MKTTASEPLNETFKKIAKRYRIPYHEIAREVGCSEMTILRYLRSEESMKKHFDQIVPALKACVERREAETEALRQDILNQMGKGND